MTADHPDDTEPPVAATGRLDWLVLLPPAPTPETVALLGKFNARERADLAAHFSEARLVDAVSPGSRIDALVCRTPADPTVALRAMAPTGVAWIECRRGWREAWRVRRAVTRSLLEVRAVYWLLPDARHARRYVPLQHRGAVRWYLSRLLVPRSRPERLAAWLLGRVPALAHLLPGGIGVVAAGPRAGRGSAALDAHLELDEGDALLVQSSGHDAGNRTIVVPFGTGGRLEGSVVKVASRWAGDDTTDAEFATLQALHEVLPVDLASSVPEPLDRWEWSGRRVTRETMFDGPTVAQAVGSGDADPVATLRAVTDWLTAFHRATADDADWSEARAAYVDSVFAAYQTVGPDDPEVARLLARASARSHELIGAPFPDVRRHYDLTPSNVILGAGGLGVIDWEPGLGRAPDGRGPAVCDLDYFAKFWMHVVADARDLDDELRLFAHLPGEVCAQARAAVLTYCDALGIDRRFVPWLTVYHWVEQALADHRRAARLGGLPAERQKAVHYVQALSRTQDRLFSLDP